MLKTILLSVVLAAGCGGVSSDHSSVGSGSGGSPVLSGGSAGADTSSSSLGGGGSGASACGSAILAPFDCTAAYPDPERAFDPAAAGGIGLGPAPGETPDGAVAGRVDARDGIAVAVLVRFAIGVPADPQATVWQEPVCGLPNGVPPWQVMDPATVTTVEGVTRLPFPGVVPLDPAQGYTWAAVRLTGSDAAVLAVAATLAGPHEPRFAWRGRVDRDCSGEADIGPEGGPLLDWEDIRTPSAPDMAAGDFDLAIGVERIP